MKNNLTWLLVADASKARIYTMHKAALFQAGSLYHKYNPIAKKLNTNDKRPIFYTDYAVFAEFFEIIC